MIVSKELVTRYDPSKAYDGYTIFGSMGSGDVHLVDMKGRFVHRWHMPHPVGPYGKLLPNGNLLVGQRIPSGPVADLPASGGDLLEVDWDGNVVWKYEDLYMNAHDFDRMKNGNTLISHWIPIPSDIAAKIKGGVPGSEREGVMWGDCFQEISPDGKVVWQWIAHEHMDFDTDILCPLCQRDASAYVNSLVALPDGNILTNFRLLNTVAIIDKGTGDIKWRWGPDQLGHAHNPTFLDNGNILVFDNDFHRKVLTGPSFSRSRVVEVSIKTKKIVWEYQAEDPSSFYSPVQGGAQRLPNGNTLICESTKGRFFEVTQGKEVVWDFTNPFYGFFRGAAFGVSNWVYRAYRYGPDYEGLRGKTLDPDRFKWVLEEEGKARVEETAEEETVSHRLAGLGY